MPLLVPPEFEMPRFTPAYLLNRCVPLMFPAGYYASCAIQMARPGHATFVDVYLRLCESSMCFCRVENWRRFAVYCSTRLAFEVEDDYVIRACVQPRAGQVERFLRTDIPDAAKRVA